MVTMQYPSCAYIHTPLSSMSISQLLWNTQLCARCGTFLDWNTSCWLEGTIFGPTFHSEVCLYSYYSHLDFTFIQPRVKHHTYVGNGPRFPTNPNITYERPMSENPWYACDLSKAPPKVWTTKDGALKLPKVPKRKTQKEKKYELKVKVGSYWNKFKK